MKRTVFRITVTVFIILLHIVSTYAQRPQVKTTIDTTRILIGDQVNILFELETNRNDNFLFPVFKDTLMKNLEILSVSPIDSHPLDDERTRLLQRILVTSFDTGFYIIPSLYFIDSASGDSLRSEALPLEVLTLEIDTTKGITDIKMPMDVPVTFAEILPYLVVGILLTGLIVLLIYLNRKRKKKPAELPRPKPAEPAHVWALRELDRLAQEKLWQQGKYKFFHSRLSEILRSYLEYRYYIPAMEQTTAEIMLSIQSADIQDTELLNKLQQTIELSDLVKFAKWIPIPEENEKSMEVAYEFVYKTKLSITQREADQNGQVTKMEDGNE